jgi:SAM-dependent methyltransferase
MMNGGLTGRVKVPEQTNRNDCDWPRMPKTEFQPSTYWETRLDRQFDLAGVGFRRRSEAYNRWVYRVRLEMMDRILKEHGWPIEGMSVLDAGSGTGVFIDYWTRRGAAEVTGVDFTEVAVQNLRKSYPKASFHRADLADPNLNVGGPYDYISVFDVMFHVVEYGKFSQAAKNLAKMCRPGTKVIITDDFGSRTRSTIKHVRKRSLEMYQEVFAAAGFRLSEVRPLFFGLLPPEGCANGFMRWLGILAWEAVTFPARFKPFGGAVGATMYGFDSVMRRLFSRTPSGQLAVFEFQGTSVS